MFKIGIKVLSLALHQQTKFMHTCLRVNSVPASKNIGVKTA